eukprot:3836523-Pyramimonas_sp.AAC.1
MALALAHSKTRMERAASLLRPSADSNCDDDHPTPHSGAASGRDGRSLAHNAFRAVRFSKIAQSGRLRRPNSIRCLNKRKRTGGTRGRADRQGRFAREGKRCRRNLAECCRGHLGSRLPRARHGLLPSVKIRREDRVLE